MIKGNGYAHFLLIWFMIFKMCSRKKKSNAGKPNTQTRRGFDKLLIDLNDISADMEA